MHNMFIINTRATTVALACGSRNFVEIGRIIVGEMRDEKISRWGEGEM